MSLQLNKDVNIFARVALGWLLLSVQGEIKGNANQKWVSGLNKWGQTLESNQSLVVVVWVNKFPLTSLLLQIATLKES